MNNFLPLEESNKQEERFKFATSISGNKKVIEYFLKFWVVMENLLLGRLII
jgi:hypothetical protein